MNLRIFQEKAQTRHQCKNVNARLVGLVYNRLSQSSRVMLSLIPTRLEFIFITLSDAG